MTITAHLQLLLLLVEKGGFPNFHAVPQLVECTKLTMTITLLVGFDCFLDCGWKRMYPKESHSQEELTNSIKLLPFIGYEAKTQCCNVTELPSEYCANKMYSIFDSISATIAFTVKGKVTRLL